MKVVVRCPPELEGRLPPPVPAREGLPAWLRDMPATAPEPDLGFELRTLKQCPPFVDAMGAGFLMPLAADVTVRDGAFEWDWEVPPPREQGVEGYSRSPISLHFPAQAAGSPLFAEGSFILKFNSFWTIELPAGVSLLVLHPINREELPFRSLTGLVDADSYKDAFVHFPARWLDPGFEGLLPRGTPVAQCIPVRREPLALETGVLSGEAAVAFMDVQAALEQEPGVYRKRFRARRPASE